MTAAALIFFGMIAVVVILGFIGAHQAIPTFGAAKPRHARRPRIEVRIKADATDALAKLGAVQARLASLRRLRPLPRRDGDDGEHVAEWLHRLTPPEPARRPRQLTDAWLRLAAITRALPLDQVPHLQPQYDDDTGQWSASDIFKGEQDASPAQ